MWGSREGRVRQEEQGWGKSDKRGDMRDAEDTRNGRRKE